MARPPQPGSSPSEGEVQKLIERAVQGDQAAWRELSVQYRDRLRRMVTLRLDRRLQGRLDPSDVLQDAYLDVAKRAAEYRANPALPVFLWLRLITGQKLMALHRKHLGAQMRNAGQVPAGAASTPGGPDLRHYSPLVSRQTMSRSCPGCYVSTNPRRIEQ